MSAPLILALMSACFLCSAISACRCRLPCWAGSSSAPLLADVSFAAIIQKVFDGVDNEALLAIPFFLLVGELMSSANVVVRIANLSMALVGHMRGGLSQVVTVFSMFFSEMSGSTTADVAVMSRALGGPMKKEGYEGPFIAAIIAAASTIAALVPPSITAVVYGATGNVSIAGLFMAGFVPGLMIGFGLMIYCYFFGPVGIQPPARFVRHDRARDPRCGAAADDSGHPARRHPDRLVHADRSRRRRGSLDHRRRHPRAQSQAHLEPAVRFLPGRADLLAAPDHHRRRQRIRLAACLSARRDRDFRLDHRHRRHRSASHHADDGAAVHDRRRLHRAGADHHHLHAARQRAHSRPATSIRCTWASC